MNEHAERFTALRPLLFTIAYEILGSATESDDVLQESYLRWADVELSTVQDTKAYLARLVTRQALNALRATARRRETYVGPWLPEPLLLDESDPADDMVLADSVSMAMMVVLETLGPDERAVFVLREVFGFDYDEIAAAVGKSTAAVRQHRVFRFAVTVKQVVENQFDLRKGNDVHEYGFGFAPFVNRREVLLFPELSSIHSVSPRADTSTATDAQPNRRCRNGNRNFVI